MVDNKQALYIHLGTNPLVGFLEFESMDNFHHSYPICYLSDEGKCKIFNVQTQDDVANNSLVELVNSSSLYP